MAAIVIAGQQVLVDDCDLERVRAVKWSVYTAFGNISYVTSRVDGKTLYMHRYLTGAPPGIEVDHKDGCGLNNQRANLRLATHQQNCCNMRHHRDSKSPFKGVTWDKSRNRWAAQLMACGKKLYLGRYRNACDAAQVYMLAAFLHHGQFARVA